MSSDRARLFYELLSLEERAISRLPASNAASPNQLQWPYRPAAYSRGQLAKALLRYAATQRDAKSWLPAGAVNGDEAQRTQAAARAISDAFAGRHRPRAFGLLWAYVTILGEWAEEPQDRERWVTTYQAARPERSKAKGSAPSPASAAEPLPTSPFAAMAAHPDPPTAVSMPPDRSETSQGSRPNRWLWVVSALTLVVLVLLGSIIREHAPGSTEAAGPLLSVPASASVPPNGAAADSPSYVEQGRCVVVDWGPEVGPPNWQGVALSAPQVEVHGTQTTFTWTVRTSTPMTFAYLQLKTKNQEGSCFLTDTTIKGTTSFSVTQQVPAGSHTTQVVYQLTEGSPWMTGTETRYEVEEGAETVVCETPEVAGPDPGTINANGVAVSQPHVTIADGEATFVWTVRTAKPVTFDQLQLTTIGQQEGACYLEDVTIHGTKTFTTTHPVPPGVHTTGVTYQLAGHPAWDGGPEVTFTVP